MHNPLDALESLSACRLLGPAPCDDCALRARCEMELLACESYCLFVRDLAHWDAAAREPTRARYLSVFDDKKDPPPDSQLRWLNPSRI
jgi:hypothetical protein